MEDNSKKLELNRNGNRRGMHSNSRKNLRPNANPNGRPTKEFTITARQREMLPEICPYDPQGRTWRDALAEAQMRQALVKADAHRDLRERLEGRVPQPLVGEHTGTIILRVIYDDHKRG